MDSLDLAQLTQAHFTPHLGTEFQVILPGNHTCALTLQAVEALGGPAQKTNEGKRSGFALIFHGPTSKPLGQNTFTLAHQEIGKFALFLVPVGETNEHRTYETIFN